jgi:hypothetical protein
MHAIKGTFIGGQIVLGEPTDWPDGTPVVIEPVADTACGMSEKDWQDTPEAIEAWLRWYDALEPLVLTPEEEAHWQAARQAQKDYEKTAFEERAEKLRRLWP